MAVKTYRYSIFKQCNMSHAKNQNLLRLKLLKVLCSGQDKAGEFYRQFHYALFSYISHRIPEISDEVYRIDDALMAGFGWEIGAFESWDTMGVAATTEAMKAA